MQCDVVLCNGACENVNCDAPGGVKGQTGLAKIDDNILLAATTVFVRDPADAPCKSATYNLIVFNYFLCVFRTVIAPFCEDSGVRPTWLLWLTIALGVLFLIMLLMNIFLCTAMSCSCARTEVYLFFFRENYKSLNGCVLLDHRKRTINY